MIELDPHRAYFASELRSPARTVVRSGSLPLSSLNIARQGQEQTEIDCTNSYVWPGLIDSHVHFRTPGEEYKEDWISGSAAALAGGVTSVVDMPSNIPPQLSLADLDAKRTLIDAQTRIDYRLIVGVNDHTIPEAVAAAKRGERCSGIKVYLTPHSTGMGITTPAALQQLYAQTDSLLLIHAEDDETVQAKRVQYHQAPAAADHSQIRDRAVVVKALEKILALVRHYKKPTYICHVSTVEEIELIAAAKHEGLPIYAEVTPHHLLLNDSDYERLGMLAKVNPPLRTRSDNVALCQAIRAGVIDVIATDHAPHLLSEKQKPYDQAAAGLPSIEFFLPLLLTLVHEKKLTLGDIERCCITQPAHLFGFTKTIQPGSTTDVVVFNPTTEWTITANDIKSKAGWSPYLGWKLHGQVTFVTLGGIIQ